MINVGSPLVNQDLKLSFSKASIDTNYGVVGIKTDEKKTFC